MAQQLICCFNTDVKFLCFGFDFTAAGIYFPSIMLIKEISVKDSLRPFNIFLECSGDQKEILLLVVWPFPASRQHGAICPLLLC